MHKQVCKPWLTSWPGSLWSGSGASPAAPGIDLRGQANIKRISAHLPELLPYFFHFSLFWVGHFRCWYKHSHPSKSPCRLSSDGFIWILRKFATFGRWISAELERLGVPFNRIEAFFILGSQLAE